MSSEGCFRIRAACAQVDDLAEFAAQPVSATSWAGRAALAYRARARGVASRAAHASLGLSAVVEAVETYLVRRESDPENALDALREAVRRLRPGHSLDPAPVEPAQVPAEVADGRADPDATYSWWHSLGDAERQALLVSAPGLLGRLDGLPSAVRGIANRTALARDLAAGRWRRDHGVLPTRERRRLRVAGAVEDALTALDRRGHSGVLLEYQPGAFDGDGRAAIAVTEVPDLDRAAHVGVVVPGVGNDADDIGDLARRAANLVEAGGSGDRADPADPGPVAAVAWIGYDAPDHGPPGIDLDRALTPESAERGGQHLRAFVDGLRTAAADDGEPAHLTVIGHSYGSTTVAQAARAASVGWADELVLLGSPGAGPGVGGAGDLVGGEHVWVGANSRDPVAQLGDRGVLGPGTLGLGLGHDPAEDRFDAWRFRAESVTRAGPGDGHHLIEDHLKYFDHDTESLSNLGRIVTDRPDQVSRAAPVHDSWLTVPEDPEWQRTPAAPATNPGRRGH
ncbi:MAG: alpha/beta hydrolase [Nocardioides sp.]